MEAGPDFSASFVAAAAAAAADESEKRGSPDRVNPISSSERLQCAEISPEPHISTYFSGANNLALWLRLEPQVDDDDDDEKIFAATVRRQTNGYQTEPNQTS